MLFAVITGVLVGIAQVYCLIYYVSALDKNNTVKRKLTRWQVGLINAVTIIGYIVCFVIFDRNSLIAAVIALCGSIMIFTLYKFIIFNRKDGKDEGK